MRGKSAEYIASYIDQGDDEANFVPGKLHGDVSASFTMNERVFKAIKIHLQTRAYTDERWQSGTLHTVDESLLRDTCFGSWKAYRADSDNGSQRYRIADLGTKDPNFRNASWVTVSRFWTACIALLSPTVYTICR
jgi:hypothetical protein